VVALLMSDAVYDAVFDSLEHAFSHGSTFAPNDYATVAGLAALRELDDRDLVGASDRLGELLLQRTRPLVERYQVVKEVRGLGLMWAIEFGEPDKGRTTWRMLERMQPGIFAQLVVVPLFTDHRILSQVAGHRVNVVKGLPPLTITEEDVEWFAEALDQVVGEAQKMGKSMTSFALRAARAGRKKATPARA
jgi:ornithine--oxo-acid transaminase